MTAAKKQEEQTTAVVARQPQYIAMPVQGMADLQNIGQMLAQSGLLGISNPAAGMVVALTCYQTGQTLFDFGRTYHIIDNKPAMRADAMLAEFRRKGGRYTILENGDVRAAAEFSFEGKTITFEYTLENAKANGYYFKGDGKTPKHTWASMPEDMLWARMVSRAVRRLCPEIVAGVYTPEEMQDFDTALENATPVRAYVSTPVRATIQVDAVEAPIPAAADADLPMPDFSKAGEKANPPPAPPPAPVADARLADPNVCPIGEAYGGKLWAEIPLVDLRKAAALPANYHPSFTAAHRKALSAVIAHKEGGDSE